MLIDKIAALCKKEHHAKLYDERDKDGRVVMQWLSNGREVYCNICTVCGLPFNTLSEERMMCVDCARETKQEGARKKKAAKPVVPLEEQMRIIDAYNRDHGTTLSYGKYMAMMRAKEGEARVKVRL